MSGTDRPWREPGREGLDEPEVRLQTPFTMVPHWLVPKVSGAALRLYVVLGFYADNHSRTAHPYIRTLADKTGSSPRTVQRLLRELEQAGALTTEHRPGPKGDPTRSASNIYTLVMHERGRGG